MTHLRDEVDSITQDWARIHPGLDVTILQMSLRLARAGRIIDDLLDKVTTQHGFTVHGDYAVLATLRRNDPKPMQPSELADRLAITTSGITGRLDRLERAGLVVRRPHPEDRRGVEVFTTSKGVVAADNAFRSRLRAEQSLLQDLDLHDRERITESLRQIGGQLRVSAL